MTNAPPTIVEYARAKRQIGVAFWSWTIFSIVAGAIGLVLFRENPLAGAFSIQFLIWGLINLVFAIMGLRDKSPTTLDWANPQTPIDFRSKLDGIARYMALNHKLDLLWVSIGVLLLIAAAIWWSSGLLGHGVGVTIQGIALMLIDRTYAGVVKRTQMALGSADATISP